MYELSDEQVTEILELEGKIAEIDRELEEIGKVWEILQLARAAQEQGHNGFIIPDALEPYYAKFLEVLKECSDESV